MDYVELSKKTVTQLVEIAVQLGATNKGLYGMSKKTLITLIWQLSNPIADICE